MKKKHNPGLMSAAAHTELSHEQIRISKWLGRLRFRKQLFGGVREEEVWKKIDELNSLYQEALKTERVRYDTLIEHYRKNYEARVDKDIPETEQRKTDDDERPKTSRHL